MQKLFCKWKIILTNFNGYPNVGKSVELSADVPAAGGEFIPVLKTWFSGPGFFTLSIKIRSSGPELFSCGDFGLWA